jgi:anti-sigma-K factor RskA
MSARSHGDHTEWHELAAGHALHALSALDEVRLLDHLADCDECRIELDAHALTASHLASLADDADTAPPQWSTIRAAILQDSREPVVVLADRRERRRPSQRVLAVAAGVVVLAGATVASVQVLGGGGSSGRVAPSALAKCSTTLGCQEIDLRSSNGSRRAAVIVNDGVARVQPLALTGPSAQRTFVLWQLPRSGAPIELGEFGSTTTASSPAPLAVSMAHTTAFAVSSEPVGAQPTHPTVVLAFGGVTT